MTHTGEALLKKLINQTSQLLVVVAFAEPMIERNIELGVNFLKSALGNVDALLPNRQVFRIPRL